MDGLGAAAYLGGTFEVRSESRTMPDPAAPHPSRARRRLPWIVLGVFVVLAAVWVSLWIFGRDRIVAEMDARLDRLAEAGVEIVCPERTVGGFPFRMEIACRDPGLSVPARGVGGSVAALRVVAQVWNPRLILLEADGPMVFESPREGRIDGTWRALRISLAFGGEGPERISLAAEGLHLRPHAGGGTRLSAEHLEIHGRPTGEGRRHLDLALSAAAAGLFAGDRPIGPARQDLAVTATLVDFLPLAPGKPVVVFAGRGGRIEPLRLDWSVGGIRVAGRGALTLRPDGLLDGKVGVAAQGLEGLAGQTAALGAETATLLSAFLFGGRVSTDPELPGRRIDLDVEAGRPRFGRLALPPVPPIFTP